MAVKRAVGGVGEREGPPGDCDPGCQRLAVVVRPPGLGSAEPEPDRQAKPVPDRQLMVLHGVRTVRVLAGAPLQPA